MLLMIYSIETTYNLTVMHLSVLYRAPVHFHQQTWSKKYILNIATVTCTMSSQQYSFLRYVLQELYYLEILCPMTLKSFEF